MKRRFDPSGPLRGTIAAPADKSLSHRAALLGRHGVRPGARDGLPGRRGHELDARRRARRSARWSSAGGDSLTIRGTGLRAAAPAAGVIDVGNAGTLMRLLPGWLAGQPGGSWTLDGDESIRRRPVDRIAEPLRAMGARIDAREDRFAPFTVTGSPLQGDRVRAARRLRADQVVRAARRADGERRDDRDRARAQPRPHRAPAAALRRTVTREGGADRGAARRTSSSCATCTSPATRPRPPSTSPPRVLVPGLADRGRGHGRQLDPRRLPAHPRADGRGARRRARAARARRCRPTSPSRSSTSPTAALVGTTVEAGEVPLAIDELPLVALLGCFAEGETVVRGAEELRVKETDRIATVVDGLRGLGAEIEATADGFVVQGTGGLRGGTIASHGDHRLAMLGAVAGLASREGVEVDGMEAAAVCYPGFEADLAALGGR